MDELLEKEYRRELNMETYMILERLRMIEYLLED